MEWKSKGALAKLDKSKRIVEVKSSASMKEIFREELMKEIKDGIVTEVMEKEVKHWNPSFIIPNAGGKFRKILECREVNKAT
jgi:hypothetical protein